MIGEIDIYGVFLPPLLLCTTAAVTATAVLRALLERVGFYRLVWHRALFDASMLVLMTGAASFCLSHWNLP